MTVDATTAEQFDHELKEMNMEGHWIPVTADEDKMGYKKDPYTFVEPYDWKCDVIYKHLMRAGEIHELEGLADRRTRRLTNPAFRNLEVRRGRSTNHTIHN